MNHLRNLAAVLVAVMLFSACGGDYKTTDSGLKYKFHRQSDGEKPQVGDFITIEMYYASTDSILFDSKNIPNDLIFPLDSPQYQGDFFEGIMMMSKGDSASFIVSADSFFLVTARASSLPPFIEEGSFLTFEVALKDFKSAEEQEIEDAAALDEMRAQAETDLQEYLDSNNITTEPLESGLIFIEEKEGRGPHPKAGEMVKVHLTVSLINGEKIFSTADRGEPFEYEYGQNFDTRGLEEGVGMLKKGGKAKLIVPHSLAYGAESRGQMIPPYSTIIYDVELVSMRSKEAYDKERKAMQEQQQAKEEQRKQNEKVLRDKYLSDNNITVEPTASGLYYIENEKGTGKRAMPGNTVYVHYTGRLLDGTVFDSSRDRGEPFSFRLGVGQVIKGWDEAIAMMNEGGKATLVIPSDIAYGSRDSGKIPAYSTLVFDVELVKVETAPQQ
ncbi:MAG: FKBP-type peptidyl-prolyl cis-trans isomerase [Bacteroidales bacterium]|nr:FKBP-type peptidyl-prolyl cis-trans isomerase [Bacteroidales bacterium]